MHRDPRAAEMRTTLADGSIDIVKYRLLFKEALRTDDWTECLRFTDNVPKSAWDILCGVDREREPPPLNEKRKKDKYKPKDIELDDDIYKKALARACKGNS